MYKVRLTKRFIVENADVGIEAFESLEDLKKGWSRSTMAVGLSAGFLWKQHWRKSFPSGDSFSGIGGVLFNTLNITWCWKVENVMNRWTTMFQETETWLLTSFFFNFILQAYPFKLTPRRFSIQHFNYGATQTPNVNCQSKIRVGIFQHCSFYDLMIWIQSYKRICYLKNKVNRRRIPLGPSSTDYPSKKDHTALSAENRQTNIIKLMKIKPHKLK